MLRFGASGLPEAPVEVADEVELYARDHGRNAKVQFIPTLIQGRRVVAGTWLVRFTLRPDDPRMQAYQEGEAAEPDMEDVWIHEPDPSVSCGYRPLDIYQMGASGIREFLERGNLWSGRGEFMSLEQQVKAVREQNNAGREAHRAEQKEQNRLEQREKRRWRLKIPFLNVAIDLPKVPRLSRTTTKES